MNHPVLFAAILRSGGHRAVIIAGEYILEILKRLNNLDLPGPETSWLLGNLFEVVAGSRSFCESVGSMWSDFELPRLETVTLYPGMMRNDGRDDFCSHLGIYRETFAKAALRTNRFSCPF